jgi:hypothetical protein
MRNLDSDPVYQTMRRLAERLERRGIPYAMLAVQPYGASSVTDEVDVLMTGAGLNRFREEVAGAVYKQKPGGSRRFVDFTTNISVETWLTGHHPGIRGPGPVAFPDPSQVGVEVGAMRVVSLPQLAQVKLAARRYRDSADVVSLIEACQLNESFADQLHPSVRADYFRCLEEIRRQEQFEAGEI